MKKLAEALEEIREKTKTALLERLVRLGATDVPGTPRLLMKQRSPEELAALQHGVTSAFQKLEEPAKKAVHGVIDKIPHAGTQRVLKSGANALIENPEMLPITALPVPGVSVGYLAAKKGLERGLDKLVPLPKVAFATNAFSGPMNPVIESGASFQPGFKMPNLRAPVQQKTASPQMNVHLRTNVVGWDCLKNIIEKVNKHGAPGHSFGIIADETTTGGSLEPRSGNKINLGGWDGDGGARVEVVETKLAFKLQGHISHQGMPIAVENRKGSVRKGVDKDGKPWRTKMKFPYGYLKGTKGADGEEVDCYVGPDEKAPNVYVIHQKKDDGSYDEDKLIFGVHSAEEAKKLYLAHYNTDKYLGPIKEVPIERLKKLISMGKTLVKISTDLSSQTLF